jgi:hypothetical protein
MRDRLPRAARITISTVKVGAVVTIVAAGIAMAPSDSPASGSAGLPATSGYSGTSDFSSLAVEIQTAPAERMFDRHACSPTGFDDGSQPLSAVVRTARGALRFVDFETGWEVYTRHGAATLVAVCLDEPPTR